MKPSLVFLVLLVTLVAVGCGSYETGTSRVARPVTTPASSFVQVPNNNNKSLAQALQRLHDAGLRASFPATMASCGGFPSVHYQTPRAPARVRRGSIVAIHFLPSFHGLFAVPKRHPKFTTVPRLVGREAIEAIHRLRYIQHCVEVRAATATSSPRLVVVAQDPKPGTRVRAVGVKVGRGFRPTTVSLTVAAE